MGRLSQTVIEFFFVLFSASTPGSNVSQLFFDKFKTPSCLRHCEKETYLYNYSLCHKILFTFYFKYFLNNENHKRVIKKKNCCTNNQITQKIKKPFVFVPNLFRVIIATYY